MESKTPYNEVRESITEVTGDILDNSEIDDFIHQLAKRGIVLTKFHPMTERPEDLETIQLFFGGLYCGSYQYRKRDDSIYINGNFSKKWRDVPQDGYSWIILPTAPKL